MNENFAFELFDDQWSLTILWSPIVTHHRAILYIEKGPYRKLTFALKISNFKLWTSL